MSETTSIVQLALLGMTPGQKEDLLRLHEQLADTEHLGERHLIDKAVRGGFVKKVAPKHWEFNELGEAVVRALKSASLPPAETPTAAAGSE